MDSKAGSNRLKIIAGLMLAFFILTGLFLSYAGSWLVFQKTKFPADIGIILMGRLPDRVLEAITLLKEENIKMVVVPNNIVYDNELLVPYGFELPSEAQRAVVLLGNLGVSDSLIRLLPGNASSTRMEAEALAGYLLLNPHVKSVALITSASHRRRAFLIFSNVLNEYGLAVNLQCCPSRYSSFQPKRWYSNRESAKEVAAEYLKLLWFFLVEKW
ncbi:MAG TPA: ElyC/SanA/YdcF family protein [Bacteroidales bacterium]|nr:ElyC/SanA/YdcF family protein [Bacteroidales bacterium]